MVSRYRSRRKRRSIFPALILIAALALAAFAVFRLFSDEKLPVSDDTPQPEVSDQVAEGSEPPEEPEIQQNEQPSIEDAPWNLTLANREHPLPADWVVETRELPNGLLIDARIYDALMAMLNDCKADGLSPIVCSAYRTIDRQTELFNKKINSYMEDGLAYDEAYEAASKVVAIPGTSEHNLGLSVDICALDYQLLDDAQADTAEQKWLMEHCADYGFILRYPKGKEDITGIIWEPWHYRYVGVELAKEITASGLCLEEYLAQHYSGV